MQNNIDTQRNSPSSPQEQADNTEGVGEGLDVTACSASSFVSPRGAIKWHDTLIQLEINLCGLSDKSCVCGVTDHVGAAFLRKKIRELRGIIPQPDQIPLQLD